MKNLNWIDITMWSLFILVIILAFMSVDRALDIRFGG